MAAGEQQTRRVKNSVEGLGTEPKDTHVTIVSLLIHWPAGPSKPGRLSFIPAPACLLDLLQRVFCP